MPRYLVVCLIAAAFGAQAAPAPAPPANSTAPEAPVALSENWAKPAVPSDSVIRRAVRESIIDEREEEQAAALAASKAAAIPVRFTASSRPDEKLDKYQRFERGFIAAKVPGCFKPDGLKRQSTFFLSGFLALPFIPIAALRGKCN
jgi:hypothetical protein